MSRAGDCCLVLKAEFEVEIVESTVAVTGIVEAGIAVAMNIVGVQDMAVGKNCNSEIVELG